jgi:hypothetical protein
MDTMLLLLQSIFYRFFYTDNNWFCRGFNSAAFFTFVMPLSEAVCYISIFYFISTPIYVYKEWEHINKIVKKLALSSLLVLLLELLS